MFREYSTNTCYLKQLQTGLYMIIQWMLQTVRYGHFFAFFDNFDGDQVAVLVGYVPNYNIFEMMIPNYKIFEMGWSHQWSVEFFQESSMLVGWPYPIHPI